MNPKIPTVSNPARSDSDLDIQWQSERRINKYAGWGVALFLFLLLLATVAERAFKQPDLIKEIVPFAYDQQNDAYQQMMRIDQGEIVMPAEGMARADLERFVVARESYNYYNLNNPATLVRSMAVGDVAQEYNQIYFSQKPLHETLLDNVQIVIDVTYVAPTGGETRTVRFTKTMIANSKETVTQHIATLTFEYDAGLELPQDQAMKNPSRMQVYYYNVETDMGGDL